MNTQSKTLLAVIAIATLAACAPSVSAAECGGNAEKAQKQESLIGKMAKGLKCVVTFPAKLFGLLNSDDDKDFVTDEPFQPIITP